MARGKPAKEEPPVHVGEGRDWATEAVGVPWDFSHLHGYMNYTGGLDSLNVEAGKLKVVLNGKASFSFFHLLFPGTQNAYPTPMQSGLKIPLDADTYKRLSIRVASSDSGAIAIQFGKKAGQGGMLGEFPVKKGWNVITRSLRDASWEGEQTLINVVLKGRDKQVFLFDWVRFTAPQTGENTCTIPLGAMEPGPGELRVFLDTDREGFDGEQILAVENPEGKKEAKWGGEQEDRPLPRDFPPGAYHVYFEQGDRRQYGPKLVIEPAPWVEFVTPSFTAGTDYATSKGNPWDFNDAGDVLQVRNVSDYIIRDGRLRGVSSHEDPQVVLNTRGSIDSMYRYLTFTFTSEKHFASGEGKDVGGLMRWFWGAGGKVHTGRDILVTASRTYHIDLWEYPTAEGEYAWMSGERWTTLRFDPNENQTRKSWEWELHDVKLCAPITSDTGVRVDWKTDRPAGEGLLLEFYYDTDNKGFDGKLIGRQGKGVESPSGRMVPLREPEGAVQGWIPWMTQGLKSGEYYIYVRARDRYGEFQSYSAVPVIVDHDLPTLRDRLIQSQRSKKKDQPK